MSVPISGILLDPYGNVARFADIKFVTVQGALDVIESSSAVFRTDENGAYSIDVQLGRFAVLMRFNGNNGAYDKIQTISVNSDTVASTLGELLAYTEPLTPAEILLVQQLVAQAIAAKDDAEAAALQAAIEAANAAASAAAALASEIAAANSVALLAPVPLNGGVWASGQTFTAYNQYMIYNGEAYSPRQETALPYTVGATPDLGFVYQIKLNSLQALSGLTDPSDLDKTHRAEATLAMLASGDYVEGSKLVFAELGEAKFDIVIGGTPNGLDIRDAGNGNTAVLVSDIVYLEHLVGTGVGQNSADAVERWLELSLTKQASAMNGTWVLERMVQVPANQLNVLGAGRMPVYPYEFPYYTQNDKLPTFLVTHNESDAFRFTKNSSARGSILSGFNIIRATGSSCIRALGFDVNGAVSSGSNYGYDITIERLGIFDFLSASDMYNSGSTVEPTYADITFVDCAINRNGHISRNLNSTAWNGFKFLRNKAGQNSLGGLDINAHSFIEEGNFLEATHNAVKVSGGYQGANLGKSYFEANTGDYLYSIGSLRGPIQLSPCTINSVSVSSLVIGTNIANFKSPYPITGESLYNTDNPYFPTGQFAVSNTSTATYGISSVNEGLLKYTQEPVSVKSTASIKLGASAIRGGQTLLGKPIAVQQLTTAASSPTLFTLPIAASVGDYVTVSFAIRHLSAATPSPYMSLYVNGVAGGGGRDYDFGEYNLHIDGNGYAVISATVQVTVATTSIDLSLFAYSPSQSAGLIYDIGGVTAYAVAELATSRPWIDALSLTSVTTTPTGGAWVNGDILRNLNPASGGQGEFLFISGTGWNYT